MVDNTQRVAELLLKYTTDAQSTNKTIEESQRLQTAVEAAQEGMTKAAQIAAQKAAEFSKRAIEDAKREQEQLEAIRQYEIEQVRRQQQQFEELQRQQAQAARIAAQKAEEFRKKEAASTQIVITTEAERAKQSQQIAARVQRFNNEQAESLGKVREQVDSVRIVAEKMNAALYGFARTEEIDKIAQAAIDAAKETDKWAESLEDVSVYLDAIGASDNEINRVMRSIAQAQKQQETVSAPAASPAPATPLAPAHQGNFSNTIGRLGREIRALPSVQLSGGLSTDAIGKIMSTADAGLSAIGASAAQVASAGLLAAPALIGVAIAMGNFNNIVNEGKRELDAGLNAQERYYNAVSALTTEQAREEAEAEQRRVASQRQELSQIEAARERAFDLTKDMVGGALGDAGARLLDSMGITPYQQLEERKKELEASIASGEGYVTRLVQGVEQGAFLHNELRDAGQRAVEAVEAEIRQLEARRRLEEQARRMTEDELEDAISITQLQIQRLSEARAAFAQTMQDEFAAGAPTLATIDNWNAVNIAIGEAEENLASYTRALRGLPFREALSDFTSGLIDFIQFAHDASEDARKLQEENRLSVADEYFKSIEATTEASANLAKSIRDLGELEKQTEEKLTQLEDKKRKAQLDAEEKAAESRLEAQKKRDDARLEATEDHEERKRKIEEKYASAHLSAVGNRDALAAHNAKRTRDEQLTEEDAAYQKRLEKIDKTLEKENDAIDKRLADQLKAAEKSPQLDEAKNNEERRKREQAIAQARVDLANAQRNERMLQEQHFRFTLAAQSAYNATNLQQYQQHAADIINTTQGWVAQAGYILNALRGNSNQSFPQVAPALQPSQQYQLPSYISPMMTAGGGTRGNVNVTINANGLTENQAARVVERTLAGYLRQITVN